MGLHAKNFLFPFRYFDIALLVKSDTHASGVPKKRVTPPLDFFRSSLYDWNDTWFCIINVPIVQCIARNTMIDAASFDMHVLSLRSHRSASGGRKVLLRWTRIQLHTETPCKSRGSTSRASHNDLTRMITLKLSLVFLAFDTLVFSTTFTLLPLFHKSVT